jgi:hypothetical protein
MNTDGDKGTVWESGIRLEGSAAGKKRINQKGTQMNISGENKTE